MGPGDLRKSIEGVAAPIHDVAVIGGGIAGLTAAASLLDAGLDVVVLEVAHRPGGRVHTVRYGSLHAEAGATVIAGEETVTLALLRRLSIDRVEILDHERSELFVEGRRYPLTPGTGFRNRWRWLRGFVSLYRIHHSSGTTGSSAGLVRYLLGVRRALRAIATQSTLITEPYQLQALPDLDQESFATFLNRFSEDLQPLFDLHLKVTAGDLADRYSAFWGVVNHQWNSAGTFLRIQDGTSTVAHRLAELLGPRLRLQSLVERVEAGSPAAVEYRSPSHAYRLTAQSVVLAAPPGVVASVCISLPRWKTDALRRVRFGAYVVVHLLYRERFWDDRIPGGYLYCHGLVFADLVDATRGQDGPAGVLLAFLAGPEAVWALEAEDREVIAAVERDVGLVFPNATLAPEEIRIFRWPQAIPYFPPDFREPLEALRRPVDNLVFCGDYTEGAGIHDAVVSGRRAACQVLASLSSDDPLQGA